MKYAVVTGSSRGIGAELAVKLAERGFNVAVCYNSNREGAENVAKRIANIGKLAIIVKLDVSNEDEVKKAFNYIYACFPKIDLLINNAGIDIIKPILDLSLAEWNSVIATNLTGGFLTSREVLDKMYSEGGTIINISSIWGEKGASCESVYSASKAGLEGLTKAIAKEYAPRVTVAGISVGYVDTDMNKELSEEEIANFLAENSDVTRRSAGETAEIICDILLEKGLVGGEIAHIW